MKPEPWSPQSRFGRLALAGASNAGIFLCLLHAWPFLGAIIWALTLAILVAPLHARVEKIVAQQNIAASLSMAIVIVVAAVRALFFVQRAISEAASGIQSLQARVDSGELQSILNSHPALAPLGAWIDRQFDLPSMMSAIATWLSNHGALFQRLFGADGWGVRQHYLSFYLLRGRLAARTKILAWLPLRLQTH